MSQSIYEEYLALPRDAPISRGHIEAEAERALPVVARRRDRRAAPPARSEPRAPARRARAPKRRRRSPQPHPSQQKALEADLAAARVRLAATRKAVDVLASKRDALRSPPAALAWSGGGVAGNPLTLDSDSDGEAPATDETQQPPPAAADDDDDAPIAPRTLLRNVLGLADPLQNAILHFAGTRELFHLARTYVQFRAVSLRVVKWRLPGDWTLQRMPAPDYRIYYKRVVRVRNLVELVRHRTPCARDTELHSSMSAQEQLAGASAMGRAWPRDEAAYHASRWRDVPPQPAAGAQSGRTAAASAL